MVFNTTERKVIATHRLGSTKKLCVGNNAGFLYVGTPSALGDDGLPRWELRGLDTSKGT